MHNVQRNLLFRNLKCWHPIDVRTLIVLQMDRPMIEAVLKNKNLQDDCFRSILMVMHACDEKKGAF